MISRAASAVVPCFQTRDRCSFHDDLCAFRGTLLPRVDLLAAGGRGITSLIQVGSRSSACHVLHSSSTTRTRSCGFTGFTRCRRNPASLVRRRLPASSIAVTATSTTGRPPARSRICLPNSSAVHSRHVQVNKAHVRPKSGGHVQGGEPTVTRDRLETHDAHEFRSGVGDVAVIVNDEDAQERPWRSGLHGGTGHLMGQSWRTPRVSRPRDGHSVASGVPPMSSPRLSVWNRVDLGLQPGFWLGNDVCCCATSRKCFRDPWSSNEPPGVQT